MKVDVLVFGQARERAGADRVSVEVPDAASVEELLVGLHTQHDALRPLMTAARIAVNGAFVPSRQVVRAHDELALIAMVGGG